MHLKTWRHRAILLFALICVANMPACTLFRSSTLPQFIVEESTSPTQIPASVARLAILFPHATDPSIKSTYLDLEAHSFRLKALRPELQFVDRTLLQALRQEQKFQLSGSVSDQTAIRLGQLLGADSILHYHVERPTWLDQMRARFSGQLPPVRVFSKVIRVETGEVLFHHMVSVQSRELSDDESYSSVAPLVHAAVKKGVGKTLQALQLAFR
jgi:hypothetical protein